MLPTLCLTLVAAVVAPDSVTPSAAPDSAAPAIAHMGESSVKAPFKAGDRYFFVASDAALYVRESVTEPARQLLAPRTFSVLSPSPDGHYLAYTVPGSSKGTQIRIRDVKTGRDVSEVVTNGRIFPKAWTHDNEGFAYVRVDPNDGVERIYYHTVGQPPANDDILFSHSQQPDWSYTLQVSDDGRYLIITISHEIDDHNRIYFIDLANAGKPNLNAPVVRLIDEFSARHQFIDNAGRDFLLLTDWNAPQQQIILANTDQIRPSRWPVVIPSSAEQLVFAHTAGERYLLTGSYAADTVAEQVSLVTRIYVAPTEKELQEEWRARMDSARRNGGRRGRRPPGDTRRGGGGGVFDRRPRPKVTLPSLRLTLRYTLEIPPGAKMLDMWSDVEDDELFYVVRLQSGEIRAFMYNVDSRKTTPFDMSPPSPASTAQS